MKSTAKKYGGITSATVRKATGKSWAQWLPLLDKAGAKKISHQEITQVLKQKFRVPDWWCQMVAVGYEQARGLRTRALNSGGLEVKVSRTIAAPVERLFAAWKEAAQRERWLPRTPLTIRKATPHKSIRIQWPDDSVVSVNFWPKGSLKSQVSPHHGRLATPEAAEKMKAFWAEKLEALRIYLEK